MQYYRLVFNTHCENWLRLLRSPNVEQSNFFSVVLYWLDHSTPTQTYRLHTHKISSELKKITVIITYIAFSPINILWNWANIYTHIFPIQFECICRSKKKFCFFFVCLLVCSLPHIDQRDFHKFKHVVATACTPSESANCTLSVRLTALLYLWKRCELDVAKIVRSTIWIYRSIFFRKLCIAYWIM